ncbi:MAG: hypothetical protein J2O47_10240, partial [Acidimicrobiaceae bacterium]|nr:hypothetical protein [Acidimicrobiaceae bacterium]
RNVAVRDLTVAANGAVQIRLAGEAIAGLRTAEGTAPPPRQMAPTVGLVQLEVTDLRDYYLAVADEFEPRARRGSLPAEKGGDTEGEVLESIRRDVAESAPSDGAGALPADSPEVEAAARLLWTGLYLQDMRILEARLRSGLTGSEVVGQSGGGRRPATMAAASPAASTARS